MREDRRHVNALIIPRLGDFKGDCMRKIERERGGRGDRREKKRADAFRDNADDGGGDESRGTLASKRVDFGLADSGLEKGEDRYGPGN